MFRGLLSLSAGVLTFLCLTGISAPRPAQAAPPGSFRSQGLPQTPPMNPITNRQFITPGFINPFNPFLNQNLTVPFNGVFPNSQLVNPNLNTPFNGVFPNSQLQFRNSNFGSFFPSLNSGFVDPRRELRLERHLERRLERQSLGGF